ncbi:MAG: sensor histidine kinase [Deltaproteobacteria bacterium]|nr:sensor histidine kinase [Deltaproteobacteria bacterium]
MADLARARVPFDQAKLRLEGCDLPPELSRWILEHAVPTGVHGPAASPPEAQRGPQKATLAEPEAFLHWITHASERGFGAHLGGFKVLQVFGAAAIASLGRVDRPRALEIELDPGAPASRFARAIGIEEAIANREQPSGEPGRTVPLRRLPAFGCGVLEVTARRVASLIVPSEDDQETRKTITYVVTELLRNVVQHSRDKQGAVVGAQLMSKGREKYREEVIQVAVADNGIGIFASIKGMHEELKDPSSALVKAIEPHVSGAFPEDQEGTDTNAGLGLFFVAEMAKLTGGR